MTKLKSLPLILVIAITLVILLPAQAQQLPPHRFGGDVKVEGVPAEDGTTVSAVIDGQEVSSTTTLGGRYRFDVGEPFGFAGETVFFAVGGIGTGQAVGWEAGEVTLLNLAVTTANVLVGPVGSAIAHPGAQTIFEIQADDVVNLAAAQATLTYDPQLWEKVEPTDVVLGPGFSGCLSATNLGTPGTLFLSIACVSANTGTPLTLWEVTLTAAEVNLDQQTQLRITSVTLGDVDEQEIPAAGFSLDVTILPIVCGDVHPAGGGDGDDDILDALRKLKISVGLVTPDDREMIAGDVHPANDAGPDGDGDIDILDALWDLKAAVGLVPITSCGGPSPEICLPVDSGGSSGGVGIFPTRIDFSDALRQGEYFETFGVINDGDSERVFRFAPGGEIGQWLTTVDTEDRALVLDCITVAPNTQARALLRLRVPQDAADGHYQGAVTVTEESSGLGAEISVNVEVTGGPLN